MVYGLIAALGWGLSAVAATIAARRAGTYLAVLAGQGIGVIALVVLVASLRPSFGAVNAGVAVSLAGAGLLGLLGYLAFYRALEIGGEVGLVSAISATYGGVTTLLAVVVLGEPVTGSGAAGVGLAVVGVALATARRQGGTEVPAVAVGEPIVGVAPAPSRLRGTSRVGVLLAIASAVTYGCGGFLLGDYSARAGWLVSALLAHGTSVTALLVALPLLSRQLAWRVSSASGVAWAALAGLTDAVGLLAFSRGGQAGQVAVTAAVSSVYPVIPLAAGLAFFGERLTRRQLLGIASIIVGLVLIGLG